MFLICFSLMVNDVEHLFMCLHFLFGKTSNQVFCPFLNQIKKKMFLYFWPCRVSVAVQKFSLLAVSGGCSLVVVCRFLTVVPSLVEQEL